jgi:Fic family protein
MLNVSYSETFYIMTWNWQQPGWPNFTYNSETLRSLEREFLLQSGELIGAYKHIGQNDQETLKIELISDEAVKTSEIEGEILNRASVQSSLRQQFGLGVEQPGVKPAERGISKMMVDLYQSFTTPLTDRTLFDWHMMLLSGDRSIKLISGYRTHADPMQVVSGADYKRTVHFEAPPSGRVPDEMRCFIAWFNATAPGGKSPLSALTRAGIGHLHFESIHPFEDGNRPGACGKIAGAKPRAAEPDRSGLHDRAPAQGLLRRA